MIRKAPWNPEKILRDHALKVTAARVTILDILHKAESPVSMEYIEQRMRNADQATMYRTMQTFEENGLARRVDLRHPHAHYELATDDHHHIVCVDCGEVEDIPFCVADMLMSKTMRYSQKFSRITDHSFEFFGHCVKCSKV